MATQTKDKDYYGVLGVKKSASVDDIRKAFRKLARKCRWTSRRRKLSTRNGSQLPSSPLTPVRLRGGDEIEHRIPTWHKPLPSHRPNSITPLPAISCKISPFRMNILRELSSLLRTDSSKYNIINNLCKLVSYRLSPYSSKIWRESSCKSIVFKDRLEGYSLRISKQKIALSYSQT